VTETAGFSRSSGFIDDTRAFCSIPARHDASRRVEASFLARLVAEHRISEERAREIIVDIVDAAPRRAFKL
jgi:glucuronate isomerase